MNLLNLLLKSMLSQSSVHSTSNKTGVSEALVKKLLIAALPMILSYLTRNAASNDGAVSLLGALTQHSSKRSLADQIKDADETDGDKIMGHILGNDKSDVMSTLAKETGIDSSDVAKVLAAVAPAVLSTVSASTNQAAGRKDNGLDLSDLFGMFAGNDKADDALDLFGGKTDAKNDGSELLNILGTLMKG